MLQNVSVRPLVEVPIQNDQTAFTPGMETTPDRDTCPCAPASAHARQQTVLASGGLEGTTRSRSGCGYTSLSLSLQDLTDSSLSDLQLSRYL